jgi:hypothetical protein
VQRGELDKHSKAGLGNVDAIIAKTLLNIARTREPRCRSIQLTTGGPALPLEPLPSHLSTTGDVTPMSAIPMASTPTSAGSSGRKRLRGQFIQTPGSVGPGPVPLLPVADGSERSTPIEGEDVFPGEDFSAIGSDWEALYGGDHGFWLDPDDGSHPSVGTPTLSMPDTPLGFVLSNNLAHVRRSMNV